MSASLPPFVCPRCRGELARSAEGYACEPCARRYPVVAGIPDFRLVADPWIAIDDDRAKALRVAEAVARMAFADAVRTYWAMTPSTPADLAASYVAHVLAARARSEEWVDRLPTAPVPGPWLELGCGTGDLLATLAERRVPVVGIDIALRWLVIARRRPELAEASLVCCAAEHLPFADATFARVAALGVVEHCPDVNAVAGESRRVLHRGGDLRLRTVNRYTMLREPHVRVWGVGFVPRRWADAYVRRLSGHRYLHHYPRSRRELGRAIRRAGFQRVSVDAAPVLPTERARLGALGQRLTPLYDSLRRLPGTRAALAWIAPLIEARGLVA